MQVQGIRPGAPVNGRLNLARNEKTSGFRNATRQRASTKHGRRPSQKTHCAQDQLCVIKVPEGRDDGVFQWPLVLTPCAPMSTIVETTKWVAESREAIEDELTRCGALMFRNFKVETANDFNDFILALGYPTFRYEGAGGNAVRTNVVGDRVFTANESPPDKKIPFHHELAQSPTYPSRVLFFCEIPAESGGATPILRSNQVYTRLKAQFPEFIKRLETEGVRYTRVMSREDRPDSAIGRGWGGTFGANTPEELEKKLLDLGCDWEWVDGNCVRHISAVLPAVRPDSHGTPQFFNQILAAHLGWRDELNAPGKSVIFGNGDPLPEEVLECLQRIHNQEAVAMPWQKGDIMLLDNTTVMHARQTFVGPRRVLASLCDARPTFNQDETDRQLPVVGAR